MQPFSLGPGKHLTNQIDFDLNDRYNETEISSKLIYVNPDADKQKKDLIEKQRKKKEEKLAKEKEWLEKQFQKKNQQLFSSKSSKLSLGKEKD